MNVVLLSTDLVTMSRVQGAAAARCASLTTVSNLSAAVECCLATESTTLLIDLALPSLDVNGLVSELKATGARSPRIIAFGPHVHEEKLAAAKRAGCDVVVSRGQFFAQLESLLNV